MKRHLCAWILLALLVGIFAVPASFADGYQDTSYAGWYIVNITMPAGYDHIYLYDRPSSTKGNNLGRINNGASVYAYWREDGYGNDSKWCYCDLDGKKGYIRWNNLSYADSYDDYDDSSSYGSASFFGAPGWYYLRITKPADHDHIYLYDRPSSTKGKNLGRINNGEYVYVYGDCPDNSEWAYCEINGKTGCIRWANLALAN